MLFEINRDKLGDKLLSKEEALLKSFEETDRKLEKFRLDDHEDLKNMEKRLGRPMHSNQLIYYVTRTNPHVWAEDSINDSNCANFYMAKDGKKTCCVAAFEKGFLSEFSFILVDTADLPVKEKRGWRTVLLRLLAAGALTWAQVLEVFGDAHGVNSERWRRYTQRYRT